MVTIHAISGRTITLGREGENLARQVVFDVSEWRASYGDGTVSLIAQRHGDAEPYPCNITVDGDTVTWPITSADTACPDYGHCELRYSVGDVLVKSEMWRTFVADALGTPQPEPPEPQKAWVDKVLAAGQAAVDASVNSPKIGSNGNWWVWDFDAGAYADTGVAASGGDIVRIELADYGLYFGGEGVSVPQEFVDILRDALDNRKAPYVHGTIEGYREGTVLLDTMYTTGSMIFATGVGVLVNDRAFPAWFAIVVDQERLTVSAMYGPAGADGYSPTIDVSREDDKTVLTITDVNGTKTVDIPDGKDGAVSSVNGRTGDVTLTAGDVGAVSVPATASVGQAIVVKAVDADGKPTEWEAADRLPKSPTDWEPWTTEEQTVARERIGIPGAYALVNEIVLSEEVSAITLNKTASGKNYNFSDVIILVEVPNRDNPTCFINLNGISWAGGMIRNDAKYHYIRISVDGGRNRFEYALGNDSSSLVSVNTLLLAMAWYPITKITEIKISKLATKYIPEGVTFKVYAR